MGGFGNAQRNAVTAAAIAITLTRRIAEPGRTEQPFRRGKMAATGPGRADHIGGSARGWHLRVAHAARSATVFLTPANAVDASPASRGEPGDALLTEVIGIHVLPG